MTALPIELSAAAEEASDCQTMRDAALALASHRLRVCPVNAFSKWPPILGFTTLATHAPDQISAWWSDAAWGPDNRNIGVLTGDGYLVVDVDVKGAAGGEPTDPAERADYRLKQLEARLGAFSNTWLVRTPSGGLHAFLKAPPGPPVPGSISKLAYGVDIKGRHGYVLGVGSETVSGRYGWVPGFSPSDLPMAEAPSALIAECRKHGSVVERDPTKSLTPLCEVDAEHTIERAVDFLAKRAEIAVEGEGGHDALIRVAMRVMDLGVSPETTANLMNEYWSDRCDPPWDPEELTDQVGSAARSRRDPIGSRYSPPAGEVFEVIDPAPAPGAAGSEAVDRRYTKGAEALARLLQTPVAPLVERLLDPGCLSIWYGPSNVGKTFALMNLSDAIAAGEPWAGRVTAGGLVVYVALEGGRGALSRFAALMKDRPVEHPFVLLQVTLDILNGGADVEKLIVDVEKAEAEYGLKCVLLTIDTFSRALSGGDENSSKDMGAAVKHIDRIRSRLSAHLAVVHHSGKDADRGARGHSLLKAALDTEVQIDPGVITVTKQREYEFNDKPIAGFRIRSVLLGVDAEGEFVTGARADMTSAGEAPRPALNERQQEMLDALIDLAAQGARKVTSQTWNTHLNAKRIAAGLPPHKSNALTPHRDGLLKKKWIRLVGTQTYELS